MNTFTFSLEHDDSLIRVATRLDRGEFTLALDTGATHTLVDLTAFLLNGYELSQAIRTVEFETAKGTITTYVFKVKEFTALGKTMRDAEVAAYDFLSNNLIFDLDGVLGLDFFKEGELAINFKTFQISFSA